jgi:hypothetical protein
MNEIIKKDDYLSTSSLSKLGISAIGYTAAGVFLFILNVAAKSFVPGIIIGGLVGLFGLVSLKSKDLADRRAGVILTAAGALTVLSKIPIPFIQGFSSVILGIGAVGLLVLGIWNGIKFFIGLKKRS